MINKRLSEGFFFILCNKNLLKKFLKEETAALIEAKSNRMLPEMYFAYAGMLHQKYPMSPAVTCPRCSKRTNISRPSARFWNGKGPAQTEEAEHMNVKSNRKSPYRSSERYGLFV